MTTGYAVLFQYVTQNSVAATKRKVANAKLAIGLSRIEGPMGCYAELCFIFLFKESAPMDPQSGYRVVGYSEYVAKMVAFILFDT